MYEYRQQYARYTNSHRIDLFAFYGVFNSLNIIISEKL
nr:MAG TPA: hypothetical protein [Caudoviricetes sp.]